MMDDKILVFVYGTLRKHEQNSSLMKNATCVSMQAWTYGALFDSGNGYPTMVCDSSQKVYGELYEISKEQLHELDGLVGNKGEHSKTHYDRITQTVYTAETSFEKVVVYVYKRADHWTKVVFGDWKCHKYLNQDKLLYFAYGSCMDDERFHRHRVQHLFHLKGCGKANNFSLAYTRLASDGGRADMLESKSIVEGKVYEITQEGLNYLYRREGVHANIYRPAFIDIDMNGKTYYDVLTFLVIDKMAETAPPEHYAREILRGAKGFLSDTYFAKLEKELYDKFQMKVTI